MRDDQRGRPRLDAPCSRSSSAAFASASSAAVASSRISRLGSPQQRAGEHQPLALAAGKLAAAVADALVEPAGKARTRSASPTVSSARHKLFVVGARSLGKQIAANAVVEHARLLPDVGDARAAIARAALVEPAGHRLSTAPAGGGSSPATRSTSVVLPAPGCSRECRPIRRVQDAGRSPRGRGRADARTTRSRARACAIRSGSAPRLQERIGLQCSPRRRSIAANAGA